MSSKDMREIVEHRSNSVGYFIASLTASGFVIYDLARNQGAPKSMLTVIIVGILANAISRFVFKHKYRNAK